MISYDNNLVKGDSYLLHLLGWLFVQQLSLFFWTNSFKKSKLEVLRLKSRLTAVFRRSPCVHCEIHVRDKFGHCSHKNKGFESWVVDQKYTIYEQGKWRSGFSLGRSLCGITYRRFAFFSVTLCRNFKGSTRQRIFVRQEKLKKNKLKKATRKTWFSFHDFAGIVLVSVQVHDDSYTSRKTTKEQRL